MENNSYYNTKLELVYEGKQEGQNNVVVKPINEDIKKVFLEYFPHPEKYDRRREKKPYGVIQVYFSGVNICNLIRGITHDEYKDELKIAGLANSVKQHITYNEESLIYMEFLLHGLAEFQVLGKT